MITQAQIDALVPGVLVRYSYKDTAFGGTLDHESMLLILSMPVCIAAGSYVYWWHGLVYDIVAQALGRVTFFKNGELRLC